MSRLVLKSDSMKVVTPQTTTNDKTIATTEFVRNAINTYATVTDDSITTSKLADLQVTAAKLGTGAVTEAKLGTGAVTSSKIASNIDIDGNIITGKAITISNPSSYSITGQVLQTTISIGGGNQATAISSTGQYQLAAKSNYIYVSNNSGVSFTTITSGASPSPKTACMTSTGSVMIVANANGFAKKSTDYGQTWNDMSTISNSKNIVMSSNGTNILYSNDSNDIVYLSTNSGVSFTQVTGISSTGKGLGMSGNGQYMVIRGVNSYISSNGGSTWTLITAVNLGGSYMPNVAISFDGKYMLATSEPGTTENYFSTDYGVTWTTRNISSAYRAAMSSDGRFMLINSYGEKYYYSTNFGVTFTQSTISISPSYSQTASISDNGKYFLVVDNDGIYSYINITPNTGSLTISSMGTGVVKSNAIGLLSSGTISTAEIADNAITAAKILDGTIGTTKLGSNIQLHSTTTATTQLPTNDSTAIATTAFVKSVVPEFGSQLLHINMSKFSKNFQAMTDQLNINILNTANITQETGYENVKFGNSNNYFTSTNKYMARSYGLYKFEYKFDLTNASGVPFTIRVISDRAGGSPVNRVNKTYNTVLTNEILSGSFDVELVNGGTVHIEVDMPQVGTGGTKTLVFNNAKLVGHLISSVGPL